MATLSKTQQTQQTIEMIEAVQGNAGVGLTRGDVDDIVERHAQGGAAVGQIADVLQPTWRVDASRVAQNAVIDRAVAIWMALNVHTSKWAEIERNT